MVVKFKIYIFDIDITKNKVKPINKLSANVLTLICLTETIIPFKIGRINMMKPKIPNSNKLIYI